MKATMTRTFLLPAFLGFLLFVMAGTAMAAGTGADMFAPPTSDKSVLVILAKLFGGLLDSTSGAPDGTGDPFVNAIAKFNEAVLFIGGILLAYGILAGTMQTAHDGEMLGKKWSSMWVPLRTSLGVGMIIPAGQGYCAVQYLVMWLIVQGVGIADVTWNAYLSGITNPNTGFAVSKYIPGVSDMASNLLAVEVCEETWNNEKKKCEDQERSNTDGNNGGTVCLGDIGLTSNTANISSFSSQKTFDNLTWAGQQEPGLPATLVACGSVEFKTGSGTNPVSDMISTPLKSLDNTGVANPAQEGSNQTVAQIEQSHKAAFDKLRSSIREIAKNISTLNDGVSDYAKFAQAVDQYKTDVYQSAISSSSAIAGGGQSIQAIAANDGWLMAGAWYMKLMQMSNRVNEAMHATPVVKYSRNVGTWEQTFSTNIDSRTQQFLLSVKESTPEGFSGSDISNKFDSGLENGITKAENKLSNTVAFQRFIAMLKTPGGISDMWTTSSSNLNLTETSPVMVVKLMGDKILISALEAAQRILSSDTKGDFFQGAVAFSLLGFGMTAAYVTPMLPYILWIAGVLGWTVMVIESIIAAPLWAIMHVHPDGEGLTGRGGSGYALVLTVVLRPTLMIFGLIAAMAVMYPIGYMVTQTFASIFQMSVSGSSSSMGLITALAGAFIYVGVMMTLVNKIFSLIHILPDQIIRWVGGSQDYFGKGMEQEATAGAKGGMGQMISSGQQAFNNRGLANGFSGGRPGAGGQQQPGVHGNESGERHASAGQHDKNPLYADSHGHGAHGASASGQGQGGTASSGSPTSSAGQGLQTTARGESPEAHQKRVDELAGEIQNEWHQGDSSFSSQAAHEKAEELIKREDDMKKSNQQDKTPNGER